MSGRLPGAWKHVIVSTSLILPIDFKRLDLLPMSTLNRGLLTFGLAIALMVITGIWLGIEGRSILSLQKDEDALSSRIAALYSMREIQGDMELAYRSTLLTGSGKALEKFRSGRQRWIIALNETRQTFASSVEESQRLESLAKKAENYFTSVDKSLVDFQAGGPLVDADNMAIDYSGLTTELQHQRNNLTISLEQHASLLRYIGIAIGLALLIMIGSAGYTLNAAARRITVLRNRLATGGMHDALTGLASRQYLQDWLETQISAASRMEDSFHVLLLDLEGTSQLGGESGRSLGKTILVRVAQRLRDISRNGDFVARLEAEKFVVVFSCAPDSREVGRFAARLIRYLQQPLGEDIPEGTLAPSIGVASYPADGKTAPALIDAANKAMLQAKDSGHSCYAYRRETAPDDAPHVWEVSRF